MIKHVIVRYTVKPQAAGENAQLVKNVFAELAQAEPDGITYTAYVLDDGVTFVHVAELTGESNPLAELASFGEFQKGLSDRCDAGPAPSGATVVGSYGR